MTTAVQDGMIWMNKTFGAQIDAGVKNTPISKNLVIAIGIQETFYIWAKMYKTSTPEEVLGVCVGDTIDFPGRKTAWPKNRAELEKASNGKTMFKVARAALDDTKKENKAYVDFGHPPISPTRSGPAFRSLASLVKRPSRH
jgi:hypothetical protein